jgi:hypothetical protein
LLTFRPGGPIVNKIAILVAAVLPLAAVACNDDNSDVAGSRGALAVINVDAPSFAQSGVEFELEVDATNVGVNNIRDGRVAITFESPLTPRSVEASAGTSASISGNQVSWDLGTLDSNSQSRLHVRVLATLAAGESSRSARIRAELTGQGILAGEAVATDFVTITH